MSPYTGDIHPENGGGGAERGPGMTIRYGARPSEQRRNREVEAVQRQIWTQAVTVVFETDPAAIEAVLPPPLAPS